MPPLDPLPPVAMGLVEVLRVPMRLAAAFRTAHGDQSRRDVLLVHVRGDVDGWAECPVEPTPGYSGEFTDATALALRDHVIPRVLGTPVEVELDWPRYRFSHAIGDAAVAHRTLRDVRGHPSACAALELAVLDAQLQVAGRSLADWLGATETAVRPGAAIGLHDDLDTLLADADAALHAGAARLRLKVSPGRAAKPLAALRQHVGPDVVLQADANGSFDEDDVELDAIDEVGLACLEQPLPPDDLLGHARLAARLDTPICLDEPLTSLAAIEAAIELGACEVVCLKPARVGGWSSAREVHDRCAELGVPVWVGGMLETGVGRAANLAVAALPHMALPPDLDPRGRFEPDLADPRLPVEGHVAVPSGPGTGGVPSPEALRDAEVVGTWTLVSL